MPAPSVLPQLFLAAAVVAFFLGRFLPVVPRKILPFRLRLSPLPIACGSSPDVQWWYLGCRSDQLPGALDGRVLPEAQVEGRQPESLIRFFQHPLRHPQPAFPERFAAPPFGAPQGKL